MQEGLVQDQYFLVEEGHENVGEYRLVVSARIKSKTSSKTKCKTNFLVSAGHQDVGARLLVTARLVSHESATI
eukprot:scaffold143_cov142-Skeletonema_menzelii.AAC.1